MTKTEARADPAQEPEENTEEQEHEQLAVWFEDKKYSGLLDE